MYNVFVETNVKNIMLYTVTARRWLMIDNRNIQNTNGQMNIRIKVYLV